MPCQRNTWKPLSKLKRTFPPRKINVTSKSPVGDISVVTLIRTDTTLDHSQKAEKVWVTLVQNCLVPGHRFQTERVTNKNGRAQATLCRHKLNSAEAE